VEVWNYLPINWVNWAGASFWGDRSPGKLGTFLESTRDGTEILIYQPAKSLLIDNNSIEGTGIEADRIVEYPFEQTSRGDPQYNAAMNALMGII
jgi:hypothetical protein